ncbi:ABC transporter ATP-binding protein [Leptothrix discophora]|uniref:Nitrate/sulfonate/bicarbonate ABC transporter ATP-binding protein n=1 Tax=Leptothrix discophora TaxID=89 RepID=A0ABT9G5U9_LEPDI|nr:nitrate/sulfonate/bicarbonate ABC transporter ATP-binding protein [Leptothrix discophora]MDP4301858.1 nitrate/sulfonate/bicarbonate ABC transporter ATP-binding protein [Leptothrix discophora]
MNPPIVELRRVGKAFQAADGAPRTVLADVDFTLRENEIVALLGQSGSGKSTLLRIIAGLIPADRGEVLYRQQPLHGTARGIGMVFQSFALFPWLTVQQNVELGLEARGMAGAERARRAAQAIGLIGLQGFEGALPRELSGGMRQRVGIARALVVEPDVLLMDEAFSALDVLTGERLRDEILDLWTARQMPTRSMLIVSHSIEEAVMMADRVLILASDPGRVRYQMSVGLPRPRDPDGADVRALVDEIYGVMTAGRVRPVPAVFPAATAATDATDATAATAAAALAPVGEEAEPLRLDHRLPQADIGRMEGLLERLHAAPFHGRAGLPRLGEDTELTDEDLLPLTEALALLGLAQLERGDLSLTPLGKRYVEAEHAERQSLFGRQLLSQVPLAAHIHHSLHQEPGRELPQGPFLHLLRDSLDAEEAERVLRVAIEWGRHGTAYDYDYRTGRIQLPEGAASLAAKTSSQPPSPPTPPA